MMDRPPSPYPGARRSEQPGQGHQSEMIYNYPEQPAPAQEAEIAYDYSHTADLPQPDYPQAEPLYSQGYTGVNNTAGTTEYMEYPGYASAPPEQPEYAQNRPPVYMLLRQNWNSLWMTLTLAALFVLLAGGSLYAYFLTRSTPEKTLRTYCTALKNQDSHTLYDTYSKSAQAMTDEPHLQQGMRLIELFSGGIEECSIDSGSIHENDPQATARVTFMLYNGRITGTILHLIDENGQWRIENNTIFP